MPGPQPLAGKNIALSPAASDLGLGDQLVQQLQDQDAERKKKLMGAQQQAQSPMGIIGGAVQSLGLG